MRQTWSDLLFAHWPVPRDVVRPLVPDPLELELFEGRAWIGVIPFLMSGIRLRGLPPLPGLSSTLELNVRTYVRHRGRPGVYFFSLDAASAAVVHGARLTYGLPYYHARMTQQGRRYSSARIHRGAAPAEFRGVYGPAGPPARSEAGSPEYFLTERYSLFTAKDGQVSRGDIAHEPWPLQPAEAQLETNTMTRWLGIPLEGAPLLHFASRIDVRVDRIRRVR